MSVIIDLLNLLKIHIDGPEGHVLEGGALADIILGTGGDDYVEGKGGIDILSGGAGNDTLSYLTSSSGVNVDLTPGLLGLVAQASGGDAAGDIITANFENLLGSSHNDTLKGTSGANTIAGLAGNDSLYGKDGDDILIGGAGADLLNGDNGFDTADYSSSTAAISLVASSAGGWTGSGGDAQGDMLVSIEKITGTSGNDTFDGSALSTALNIDGGGGNDTVIGGAGNDMFAVGAGVNNISGGDGGDTFAFSDATFASSSPDPENPTFIGTLDGGAGNNTLEFSSLTFGITITLAEATAAPFAQSARNGDDPWVITVGASDDKGTPGRGDDVLNGFNISKVSLTSHNDVFLGSDLDEVVHANVGNDRLEGRGGADVLAGGAGADTFVYAAVSDSPFSIDPSLLDRIEDFSHGQNDKIDLSAIDAIPGRGDEAFAFVSGAFTGAGQLHVVANAGNGYDRVEANLDSNTSTTEFAILVKHDGGALGAGDFVL